jgi:hypothetical protein
MNREKDNIKNELNELAPTLAGMQPRENLQVPAHYFEGLQHRVMESISMEASAKQQQELPAWLNKILWLLQPQYSVAFATVVMLIVVAAVFQTPQTGIDEANISVAEIPAETVTEYLAEAEIETDAIGMQLSDNDINELEQLLAFQPVLERETYNELINHFDESKIVEEFL